MTKFVFICCVVLVVAPWICNAMTEEQKAKIHAHFEQLGMQCFETVPISEEDIMNLKNKKLATGPNVPCFLSCMLKKMGMLDEAGMLQKESALELAKKVFEDTEEVANIGDFLHSCHHVNDVAVSDGDKGCERAILALKCMMENSSKFGFDL